MGGRVEGCGRQGEGLREAGSSVRSVRKMWWEAGGGPAGTKRGFRAGRSAQKAPGWTKV